jgi:hypothetical protein
MKVILTPSKLLSVIGVGVAVARRVFMLVGPGVDVSVGSDVSVAVGGMGVRVGKGVFVAGKGVAEGGNVGV